MDNIPKKSDFKTKQEWIDYQGDVEITTPCKKCNKPLTMIEWKEKGFLDIMEQDYVCEECAFKFIFEEDREKAEELKSLINEIN